MDDFLKILMLEDNPNDAHIVKRFLQKDKLEFEFKVATTKDGFMTALDEFKPDVILLDNSLPGFSATDAILIIKQISEYIPCILVTGTASEEFASGIIKLGADDYILKDRLARLSASIEAAIKYQRSEKEKHSALVELKRNEENHRALVDRVADPFIAIDANWKFIYINKKAGQILNKNPDELINKHIWTEFPKGFGEQFYQVYHEAMETQKNLHVEKYSEVFDKWFENHIYSSRSGISIYFRDITERKKAEEELQTAHNSLRFHLENSPLAFIEWDNQVKARSWSKRAEEIFGWTEKEVISEKFDWFSRVYKEDLPEVQRMVGQLLNAEVIKNQVQHRSYTKDGGIVWCEWYNSILRTDKGEVITIYSFVKDITERKNTEESLKRCGMRLIEAQAMARIGSWEVNLIQNVHTWSDEVYNIFAIGKSDIDPSTSAFLSFIHPDNYALARRRFQEAFDTLKASSFNFRFIRKDGLIRQGYAKWRLKFDNNENAVSLHGIIQDVSEIMAAVSDHATIENGSV